MRAALLAVLALATACKRAAPDTGGTAGAPDTGGTAGAPDTGGTAGGAGGPDTGGTAGGPDTGGTAGAAGGPDTGGTAGADAAALPAPDETVGKVPEELAGRVRLAVVARGLKRPVALAVAPGDARKRLFVLEQHVARVRVIEGGQLAEKPALSLAGKVSRGNEQGLLGIAFHPRFAENGKVYLYYTDRDDHSHVVEYVLAGDAIDPKSAREIFFQEQPYSNHNGGHLEFGPDGKLYLGLGDGGAAGDPLEAGQDPETFLAKLIRFDVDAAKPTPEIVAMGLRNPWRFDFDGKTGDLYIGDVGQNAYEWVHVVAAGEIDGKNFGWNVVEGRHCYEKKRCDRSKFHPPAIEYAHDEGCSITGGVVYRGAALPQLDGVYFYADYCTGLLRSFRWAKDGVRQHWDWRPVLDPEGQLTQLSSFGVDAAGEVYLMSLSGTIWRLAPTP